MQNNNPRKLKTNLQNIYSAFESETRNFQIFVHIYEYVEALQCDLMKNKLKEYSGITKKSLLRIVKTKLFGGKYKEGDEIDTDEMERDFDMLSEAVESVGAYWVLYAVYELMRKYKEKDEVKLKEKIDDNFTKKYRKFLDFLMYALHEDIMVYLDDLEFLSKNDDSHKIIFDKEKSLLWFKGKKIKIKRKADLPLEHYILEALYENEDKDDEIYYQDIAEDKLKEQDYDNAKDWKKYYRACKALQDKIRLGTKVDDFIIFTTGKTGNVKIIKKYHSFLK